MRRVFIDECLPIQLHHWLSPIEARTVEFMGWKGKRDRDLLLMAKGEFDVLLTGDGSRSGARCGRLRIGGSPGQTHSDQGYRVSRPANCCRNQPDQRGRENTALSLRPLETPSHCKHTPRLPNGLGVALSRRRPGAGPRRSRSRARRRRGRRRPWPRRGRPGRS